MDTNKINWMLLRAYMDAMGIPYQTVGDSNIDNIRQYLCENKIMPADMVPHYVAKKYGLIDNSPNIEDVEKETIRLQKLANQARNNNGKT